VAVVPPFVRTTRRATIAFLTAVAAGAWRGRGAAAAESLPRSSRRSEQGSTVRSPVFDDRWFTTTDGVRLHVLESAGPAPGADAPVIAFVPGWSMPADLWMPQLRAFARTHRVAALDPRGQGLSEVPDAGFTIERRVADIAEFLEPYRSVVLVAWSLAALEALHYTGTHGTTRLAGLVLVDSSVGEPPVPPPSGDFRQRLEKDRPAALAAFVRAIFHTPQPEHELARIAVAAQRMSLEASLALLSYPFPRTHWRTLAHAVDRPLLYVVTPQFAEQAGHLQRNRPGTQVEIFRDAGHALFVDRAERFNRVLASFVKALSAADKP
jgi:microsomal epoxide hydrolase